MPLNSLMAQLGKGAMEAFDNQLRTQEHWGL